jgi:uncharacterized protein (TIGR02145 family)
MRKTLLSFIVPIATFLLASCSSITDEQEKHIGIWTFCYTTNIGSEAFWSAPDKDKFELNKNGTWNYGKSSGRWGGQIENGEELPTNEINLNIHDWNINAHFANQITGVEGRIISVEGVECLKISLIFSYQDLGLMDHSTQGAILVNKQYSSSVSYYFAKSASDGEKVDDFFSEKIHKLIVDEWNIKLMGMEKGKASDWSEIISGLSHSEKESLKGAFDFYDKKGKLNSVQEKFLQLLKGNLTIESLSEEETKKEVLRWMSENLNVAKFRNGDLIFEAKSISEWLDACSAGKPAWCYYNFKPTNGATYGKLYNYYAVNDLRGLAPEGWHIPSGEEWSVLIDVHGEYASRKMKSTSGWQNNCNGTNESGFSGLPAGKINYYGEFSDIGQSGYWWAVASENGNEGLELRCGPEANRIGAFTKDGGFSVRCLRD